MKNRLIWLLLGVIVFDFGITLLGQPSSYWVDPRTANEGNPVFRWFMVQGIGPYTLFVLGYVLTVGVLIRIMPLQVAIITGLVFLLSHFFAGSTWLSFHFNFGMLGPIAYAVVLSILLISILQSGGVIICANQSKDPAA
jgi:hypothetical protein